MQPTVQPSAQPTLTRHDSGDTAWMISATGLVMFMVIPGLSLYYAGMVSKKTNVLTTAMTAYAVLCLITIFWMFFGYSLSFGNGSAVIGDSSRFWLEDMDFNGSHPIAPTVPEPIFCAFQLGFAAITSCLSIGAVADRSKFSSLMLFVILWHIFVYCPIAHWNWSPQGFLNQYGIIDYAGGNVVHINSGMAALASSYVVGKRYGHGEKEFTPQNVLYTVIGACFLWVGWFGFNGGSAYAANGQASSALLMTQIAASAGGIGWLLTEYFANNRVLTVLGLLNGSIAGLIAITPAAGYVNSTGAFFIGILSGPVCYWGIKSKHRMGFDDSLDCFGLHGIAGIYGGFMTGLFATVYGRTGAFYGNGRQLGVQLYGIVVTSGWSFAISLVLLLAIDVTIGLRLSDDVEKHGMDSAIAGGRVEGLYSAPSEEKAVYGKVVQLLKQFAEASDMAVPAFLLRYEDFNDDDIESSLSKPEKRAAIDTGLASADANEVDRSVTRSRQQQRVNGSAAENGTGSGPNDGDIDRSMGRSRGRGPRGIVGAKSAQDLEMTSASLKALNDETQVASSTERAI